MVMTDLMEGGPMDAALPLPIPTRREAASGSGLLRPIPDVNGLDSTILEVARRARVILTLADAREQPGYQRAQQASLALADLGGATMLLFDRSHETWAETPHHRGPYTTEDAHRLGLVHLYGFLDAAATCGLDAMVWMPSLPLLESYDEAVSEYGVDLSVLPTMIDHPKIIERLVGECRPARVAKTLVPSVPVVEVSEAMELVLL
jgi:hypothetical protein